MWGEDTYIYLIDPINYCGRGRQPWSD